MREIIKQIKAAQREQGGMHRDDPLISAAYWHTFAQWSLGKGHGKPEWAYVCAFAALGLPVP